MMTVGMDKVRTACAALGEDGKEFSTQMLYTALGLSDPAEKNRCRRRIQDLLVRNEVVRTGDAVYRYDAKMAPQNNQGGEFHQRIWRAVRSSKPGFSMADIASVTRVSYTHVSRYFKHLESEGYVVKHGRSGNTQLYRATAKAHGQRQTPHPPRPARDPFERERGATARLVRLMMCHDPYNPATAAKIRTECRTILARFESKEGESCSA